MPWEIQKSGSQFCVVKEGTSKKAGCHPTREKAKAQMAALYANEKASADEPLGCPSCERAFLSESALCQHQESVHADEAREFSGTERKKAAKSGQALGDGSFPIKSAADLKNAIQALGRAKDKAKAKAHIIKRARALGLTNLLPDGWTGSEKAELMHSCEVCTRSFVGERSLFQHATAVHGFDETADRARLAGVSNGAPDFLLGLAPWEQGERRLVISVDRESGTRVLKDYAPQYKAETAGLQVNPQGTQITVPGLACGGCERSFRTLKALNDHASAVHQDEALEATYREREQLLSAALKNALNADPLRGRVWSYVVDLTDDTVIYEVEGSGGGENLFQSSYSIGDNGAVTFGEPTQVRRRTVYEGVTNA